MLFLILGAVIAVGVTVLRPEDVRLNATLTAWLGAVVVMAFSTDETPQEAYATILWLLSSLLLLFMLARRLITRRGKTSVEATPRRGVQLVPPGWLLSTLVLPVAHALDSIWLWFPFVIATAAWLAWLLWTLLSWTFPGPADVA